jgi:pyruvate dehydrogenase E2 component (dihydrolipoamide acetyltransferase)
MASRVVMPKLSDTMEEGRILRWIKKEGDSVETGQPLAEVETDKATVEMESYTNGVLRAHVAAEGAIVKVGGLIAIVGAAGEDITALLAQAGTAAPVAAAQPATPAGPQSAGAHPAGPAPIDPGGSRPGLRASPLALRMAAEAGVRVADIQGSGPQGRIIKRDIEEAIARSSAVESARTSPAPAASGGAAQTSARTGPLEDRDVPLNNIRRTIAKRLVQSKGPVPHFYLTIDVAMDRAWEASRALRAEHSTITITDIVVKAAALALRHHPELNASFAGDHVRQHGHVHIGLAVAIDDGLITPVIRDADLKTIEEISAESRALVDRARARKLQPDEYTGATFSISNLGMMGVEEFSAIINPPEAAILAVGSVRAIPVVVEGAIVPGYRMKVTLSVDHRVADGAAGARFLQTLKKFLEHPLLMV